jgi:hypothetical protein
MPARRAVPPTAKAEICRVEPLRRCSAVVTQRSRHARLGAHGHEACSRRPIHMTSPAPRPVAVLTDLNQHLLETLRSKWPARPDRFPFRGAQCSGLSYQPRSGRLPFRCQVDRPMSMQWISPAVPRRAPPTREERSRAGRASNSLSGCTSHVSRAPPVNVGSTHLVHRMPRSRYPRNARSLV